MSQTLPTHAQTVIIGGGSIGCNTAYQLTKLGMSDVVVLERDRLTSGTTWHAAGLIVGGLLKSEAECEIYLEGRRLYSEIEKETGVPTGFRDVGYIQLATNEERLHEMRRVAPFMRRMGIDTRTEALQRRNPAEKDKLKRQRDRLVEDSQMGTLFKVLGVCGRRWPFGVGFA